MAKNPRETIRQSIDCIDGKIVPGTHEHIYTSDISTTHMTFTTMFPPMQSINCRVVSRGQTRDIKLKNNTIRLPNKLKLSPFEGTINPEKENDVAL